MLFDGEEVAADSDLRVRRGVDSVDGDDDRVDVGGEEAHDVPLVEERPVRQDDDRPDPLPARVSEQLGPLRVEHRLSEPLRKEDVAFLGGDLVDDAPEERLVHQSRLAARRRHGAHDAGEVADGRQLERELDRERDPLPAGRVVRVEARVAAPSKAVPSSSSKSARILSSAPAGTDSLIARHSRGAREAPRRPPRSPSSRAGGCRSSRRSVPCVHRNGPFRRARRRSFTLPEIGELGTHGQPWTLPSFQIRK